MRRKICLIWAQDKQNTIGVKYAGEYFMPWGTSNKEDLKYFREQTLGHVVVMGYNTFASMNKISLDGRVNVVVTEQHYNELSKRTDIVVCKNKQEVIDFISMLDVKKKVFIIGGYQMYSLFLEDATDIYRTIINHYEPFFHDSSNHEKIYIFDIDASMFKLISVINTEVCTYQKYTLFN